MDLLTIQSSAQVERCKHCAACNRLWWCMWTCQVLHPSSAVCSNQVAQLTGYLTNHRSVAVTAGIKQQQAMHYCVRAGKAQSYLVQVGSRFVQVFVIDGVLQAATLLVNLPVLGQFFTLLIQLSKTLLQLCNLYTSAQQALVTSCMKLVKFLGALA